MLIFIPLLIYFIVFVSRILFVHQQPLPVQSARTMNMSQNLISDLLQEYVSDGVDRVKPNAITDKLGAEKEMLQADEAVPHEDDENLFVIPPNVVTPDWDVVLGSFKHYGDKNWDNFLIESEVPYFIRKLLGWSSEVLTIAKHDITGGTPQAPPSGGSPKSAPSYQMSVTTENWLITHQSKFYLRKPQQESDLDGSSSENTFYFLAPRTLAQDKLKEKWHMFLFRQFDEEGCNMTVIDRRKGVAARRFYKRVQPKKK